MKKIILMIVMLVLVSSNICLAFSVDEAKWQRIKADCLLFVEKDSIQYTEDGICSLTALMVTPGDSKYLISDYLIYRDSRTIVTRKHDIYEYDTDSKLHTVNYPAYSPKHVAITLHGVGEELYHVAFDEEKAP